MAGQKQGGWRRPVKMEGQELSVGSSDRGHQKLHGVEKRITAARRPWDSLCEGWPGQEGIEGV